MSDVFPAAGKRMPNVNAPGAAFGNRSRRSWVYYSSVGSAPGKSRGAVMPSGQLQAGDIVATHSPGGQMR
jgi:hypothetical protein